MQEVQTASYNVFSYKIFKHQMLTWANQFNICCFLDDSGYRQKHHSFDCLVAVSAKSTFSPVQDILPQLKRLLQGHNGWLFGHVAYDLKNEVESLQSTKADPIGFPTVFLFEPEIVVTLKDSIVTIQSAGVLPGEVFTQLASVDIATHPTKAQELHPVARLDRETYLDIIRKLKAHILRGDCYELNFCQEFFVSGAEIDTQRVFSKLLSVSPTPFSCFYKLYDKYLLCASPERYMRRSGDVIISQPMKGTWRRNLQDEAADEQLRHSLADSEKDKSENVMVVDLVRNDLSKICEEGSVRVDELFGVQTFPQVHQMVSTVSGRLKLQTDFADVLQATFPMGSMTGAPKKKVMELIEQYEPVKRGIFSGTVGYIAPDGDFDFNVVIRSILYNASAKYLSYLVGSGITFYSDEEKEYEECLLKAQAMIQALK